MSDDRSPLQAEARTRLDTIAEGTARAISGHLAGVDDEGRLLFQPESDAGPPVAVAIGIEASDGELLRAARRHQRAMVLRTEDATPRWILVGLVRERLSGKAIAARPGTLEVGLDGETLVLTAEREIVLRCGEASLTLRRDGKVVVSGTSILSHSQGPHRIKGATIALN